ncbi:myeloid differentiation primary response protein MyD88-A isoform X2 [Apis mellifera]|uniref:Myeloid differentiation primary response protein MyD88-A isoform X2 n=1 Tax=Apis mellifera TaxID=7460 RepID=A0A7M7GM43_APIME|nr:myeloid differentiation primary response protein MyD88-A isoform X2 [Apis mellifera]|eukprot:XP_006560503.2 myeloid differentiation primary response protein MyD88-A isoform X2 [Apis mellifera]
MTIDLSTIPLVALSIESTQVVSSLLNSPKVIPCENKLPRDWRGLAHLCELGGELMPLLISHPDPTAYILTYWKKKQKNITIKDFQNLLEKIDRWDILDDTLKLFEQLQKSQTSAEKIENDTEIEILTIDDFYRKEQGLSEQNYDAFILYADEDIKFANEMVDKLEKEYNLKLCLKDQLLGGITFEHEAVMKLISDRCNRLIVIISPNFLKSPANKFFLNYAQALGIGTQQRKIIPCLYERCRLPPQLQFMVILDYNKLVSYNFWGKLRDSIQVSNKIKENLNIFPIKNDSNLNMNNENDKDKQNTSNVERKIEIEKLQIQNKKETFDRKENSNQFEFVSINNNSKDNNKKHNHFLLWSKMWSKKGENNKREDASITKTISLPSIESLDTLNSTELIEKKNKTRLIDKYIKKYQLMIHKDHLA